MRAREFILLEYRRDITARNLGDTIIAGLADASPHDVDATDDAGLYDAAQLVMVAKMAERFGIDNDSRYRYRGQVYGTQDAAQVLERNRNNVIDDFLTYMESVDPTAKKEYVPWLTRIWARSQGPNRQGIRPLKFEDINKFYLLNAHYLGKKRGRLAPEFRDANRYQDYYKFENDIMTHYDINELVKAEVESEDRGQFREVYSDDTVRVIVPEDQAAACYWGRGTRWCTAATRGRNLFNRYNESGILYILMPRNPSYKGERYQIHPATDQWMDETDSPVGVKKLIDLFPEFFAWLQERDPKLKNYNYFTDDRVLEQIWQEIVDIAIKIARRDSGFWRVAQEMLDMQGWSADEIRQTQETSTVGARVDNLEAVLAKVVPFQPGLLHQKIRREINIGKFDEGDSRGPYGGWWVTHIEPLEQ